MKDIQQLESGIQMGDMRISNIRYADDTTLMELVFENLQISTNELEKARRRWGMKINATKCKVMTEDQQDISLNDTNIEKVEKFVFLGSTVPSIEEDVPSGPTKIFLGDSKSGSTEQLSSLLPHMEQNPGLSENLIEISLKYLK